MHSNNNKQLSDQILNIINTIIKQNYFQHGNKIYQQEKGIAMGSPISSTIAEAYLQYLENIYIKHWLDSKEILFYKRYVDDILIAYDKKKKEEQIISKQISGIDSNFKFKMTTEVNNTINYLDILICRNNSNTTVEIYRKPTETGTVIHFKSNHPYEHKIAAFQYYINRVITMPITEKSKQKEWKTIIAIAKNDNVPIEILMNLKTRIAIKKIKTKHKNSKR
jgi:hypothetical protein